MYWYVLGLAILTGAYVVFRSGFGPGDNTTTLLRLRIFGKLSIVVCFVWGFFVYPWWAPFAGILCAVPLWIPINILALKFSSSLLVVLRSQIGMIAGMVISVYGLINP